MDTKLRSSADTIITSAIRAVHLDEAVAHTLSSKSFLDKVRLVATEKTAWQIANTAQQCLQKRVNDVSIALLFPDIFS